jgi:hypothetical protein
VDCRVFAKQTVSSGATRLPHNSGQKIRLGLLFLLGKEWPPKLSVDCLSPFDGFAEVSTMILSEASDTQCFRLLLSLMEIRDSGVGRWENSSSIENTRQFNHSHCQSSRGPRLNGAHDRGLHVTVDVYLRKRASDGMPSPLLKSVVRTSAMLPTNPQTHFPNIYFPRLHSPLIANTPWNLSTSRTTPPSGPLAKVRRLRGPKRRAQRNPRLTWSSTGVRTASSG